MNIFRLFKTHPMGASLQVDVTAIHVSVSALVATDVYGRLEFFFGIDSVICFGRDFWYAWLTYQLCYII